ncbi:MAG TPA: cytochrome c oxidase assembly protein [Noviherbaspirillum sp.]|nr:cytochrome c oxidase assembly protein [Noviherbaspirillum sp.]
MRDLNMKLALLAAALFPASAHAHGEPGAHHWWTLDPWITIPLAGWLLLYARGVQLLRDHNRRTGRSLRVVQAPALAAAALGFASLFLALIWPLDALSADSFAAHMAQHMVLIALAAPLLVYAEPSVPVTRALPALRVVGRSRVLNRLLRIGLKPRVAFAVHGTVIWFWHAPTVFELAVRNDFVHALGHIAFFGSALLFWASLRQVGRAGGDGYGVAALWTLGTMMHMGFLGGIITFAPRVLYDVYADGGIGGLSPMEDQQLAGLIMWVPAALPYLVAGMGFILAWLRDADRHAPRVQWRRD